MTTDGPTRRARALRRWLALPLAAGFVLAGATDAVAAAKVAWSNGATGDDEIYVGNADGTGTPVNVSQDASASDFEPSLSADASRVAWTKDGEVVVRSADGTGAVINISNDAANNDFGARLSSDGSTVVWVKDAGGDREIYAAPSNGSGTPVNVSQRAGFEDSEPAVSGDGSLVTWAGVVTTQFSRKDVFVAPTSGLGVVQNLTNDSQTTVAEPDISVNGATIVYRHTSFSPVRNDVYALASNGSGSPVNISDDATNDTDPVITGDGVTVYWQKGPSSDSNIYTGLANGGGTPVNLTNQTGAQNTDVDVTDDGTAIVWLNGPIGSRQVTTLRIGVGASPVNASNNAVRNDDPVIAQGPGDELQPVQISKQSRGSSVDGHWKWNVAKWTIGPLWAEIYQPKKYDYRVVVDSHGFKITKVTINSAVTLSNPNDAPIIGTLTDALPGWACEVNGGGALNLPPNGQVTIATRCTFTGDPGSSATNTATFTPSVEYGLAPSADQATTAINRTPPPNAPGRRVVLKDKMAGSKGLKVLDAISGPRTAKVGYSAMLDVPPPTGIAWCHNIHNTAHLFDTETRERVARSNRVTVRICKPEDYYDKKGKPAGEDTPKIDPPKAPLPTAPKAKDGTPKITPAVGGPKKINPRYRTKLATRIMAPRVRYRGQLMRVRVITRNATTRRAYGVVVKAKLPTGMKLVAKPANVHLGKRNTIWWTRKAIGSKKRIARTLRVVAIRPKAYKLRAISNARNAKRSADRHRILVKRPPAPAPMPR